MKRCVGGFLLVACVAGDGNEGEESTTLAPGTTGGPSSGASEDGPEPTSMSPTSSQPTSSQPTSTSTSGEDSSDASSSSTGTPEPDTWFGDPRCEASDFLVCESFEDAALDGFPDGWGLRPTGVWGGNTIGVSNKDAARGQQALEINGGINGAQWLTYMGGLGPLATSHWGRMFFRVVTPAPWPSDGVLHGDLFEARGPYGNNNTNHVRWGIVENTQMRYQWIYNVQRSTNEFADGTDYIYEWSGEWVCMEWHHDQTTQEATLWLDEVEISAISQTADDDPEIPVYDDISVGWANYQNATPEFVVFIDEVVLDDERIGCYD